MPPQPEQFRPAVEPSRRDLIRAAGTVALAGTLPFPALAMNAAAHLPVAKPEDIGIDAKRLRVMFVFVVTRFSGSRRAAATLGFTDLQKRSERGAAARSDPLKRVITNKNPPGVLPRCALSFCSP